MQCHPILPIIDDIKIKNVVSNIEFSKEEIKRNEQSQYYQL